MSTAALPSGPAAIKMALGVSLFVVFVVFVGAAIPRDGAERRRVAALESRVEVVDRHMLRAVQRRRAGTLSPEGARAESLRLTAVRDSLLTALQKLADERANERSDAYFLLAGCVFGLLLFSNGYRQNNTEYTGTRARIPAPELYVVRERRPRSAKSVASRVEAIERREVTARRNSGARADDVSLRMGVEYAPAREATFDREPQDLRHAVLRIRHLTGEHVAVPRDLQLRAAHAIVDSDSPEAALRALRVSGVLHVFDRAGANTTRLTGAIPEIWHRFHLD